MRGLQRKRVLSFTSKLESFYWEHGRLPRDYAELRPRLVAIKPGDRPLDTDVFTWKVKPAPDYRKAQDVYTMVVTIDPKEGPTRSVSGHVTLRKGGPNLTEGEIGSAVSPFGEAATGSADWA